MKRLCLTIMAVALTVSACQEPVADYDEIHLLNLWPVDVWLFAVEEEPGTHIDPIELYNIDLADPNQNWASGEERTVPIFGNYTYGDDIRLSIYSIRWITVDDVKVEKMVLSRWKRTTHAQLLESSGLITLSRSSYGL